MSIFKRQWLAPSPPVVFDAFAIGLSILINYGPVAENTRPALRGMTCPSIHRWPLPGVTASTPRHIVLRLVLETARFLDGAALEELAADIVAQANEADDSGFIAHFAGKPDEPFQSSGTCLAPAFMPGDPLVELPAESIRIGDLVAVMLRGTLAHRGKLFAGIIDREGFPAALFYLKNPEQVIEVPLADVLYARKIQAPREYDGNALLAEADPFVAKWRDRYHLADRMEPLGTTRIASWVESMVSIFEVLRGQPE